MEINEWAVFVCAIVSMPIGAIWYGPLFGKKWMEITGANAFDKARCEQMKKEARPLYVVQFLLTLFQAYVLAHFIAGWNEVSAVESAMWILAGFVVPTIAGASMWTADAGRVKWARFWIQTGYQFVSFLVFAFILGAW